MKSLTSIILALFLISGCAQLDYYSANNKNIQTFETALEEETAKYMLELNDQLLLVRSIAELAKTTTRSNDVYAEAAALEQTVKQLQSQLKMKATLSKIAVSSELSKKRDEQYNKFYELKQYEMNDQFTSVVSTHLKTIVAHTSKYIENGEDVKIQQFSVQVRETIEEKLNSLT